MQDLWGSVVEVVCAGMDPVPIKVNWSGFQSAFITALSETAYDRYQDWFTIAVKRKAKEAKGESSSQMKKKRR